MNTVSFPGLGIEIAVRRVAFSIFGAEVYWYGILIALGALLAVMYSFTKLKEFGLDQDKVVDVIIAGTLSGIVGSRLYYVIFAEPGEFTTLLEVFDIRRGGVAFYGSLIGALIAAVVMCKIKKIKLLPLVDLTSIGFLIGQGIGRWGNFVNQEAFGSNTELPWGMTSETIVNYLRNNQNLLWERGIFAQPLVPVHPTFLYESLWCVLGFVLLNLYIKRRRFDGEIILMYLAWNGAGRSIIEGLRTDSLYMGNIRISQFLAFTWFILAVLAIIIIRKNVGDKRKEDPEFAVPYGHTEQCRIDMAELEESRKKKAAKMTDDDPGDDLDDDDEKTDDDDEFDVLELEDGDVDSEENPDDVSDADDFSDDDAIDPSEPSSLKADNYEDSGNTDDKLTGKPVTVERDKNKGKGKRKNKDKDVEDIE